MKKGWTYKKLGDVATLKNGFAFRSSLFRDTGFPIVRISNIQENKITTDFVYFDKKDYKENFDKYEVNYGDILIAMSGATTGKVGINNNKSTLYLNQRVGKIVPNKELNDRYLFYYLKQIEHLSLSVAQGSAQPNISKQQINNFVIPIPTNEEQERIVEYLDKAFEDIDTLKDNAQKQLDDARKLFQAALTEAMQPKQGWEMKSIGALFKTYSGGTPIKSEKSYYEKGTIPWLRSGEICRKYITKCEMYITEEGLKNSSAKYFPVDTILVAMYGATAAQVGILKFRATSNQAVCGILPSKEFVPEYVYYWFKHIENDLASQAQGGAQPNISQQKIKKVEIPIMSISEQQEIVSRLDALSAHVKNMEEINRKVIAECDALKQSILRQIFE